MPEQAGNAASLGYVKPRDAASCGDPRLMWNIQLVALPERNRRARARAAAEDSPRQSQQRAGDAEDGAHGWVLARSFAPTMMTCPRCLRRHQGLRTAGQARSEAVDR